MRYHKQTNDSLQALAESVLYKEYGNPVEDNESVHPSHTDTNPESLMAKYKEILHDISELEDDHETALEEDDLWHAKRLEEEIEFLKKRATSIADKYSRLVDQDAE